LKIGAYLTGSFGQSGDFRDIRNEVNRRDGSKKNLEQQLLKDTQKIIDEQKKAGFDFIIDPMFNLFHLFQPITDEKGHPAFERGPQEPWFHRNQFYWRPQIAGQVPIFTFGNDLNNSFTSEYINLELLSDVDSMVILPSPFALYELADVAPGEYAGRHEAIIDFAFILKREAELLVEMGVKRIQYDDPVIAVKQYFGSLKKEDLDHLAVGMEFCGEIEGATTSLHTYFGNVGDNEEYGNKSIIPYLFNLNVDCIGIDGTYTPISEITKHDANGKEIALGLIDGDTTYNRGADRLRKDLDDVAAKCKPSKLYLTSNTGLDNIGWTYGLEKMKLMSEVIK